MPSAHCPLPTAHTAQNNLFSRTYFLQVGISGTINNDLILQELTQNWESTKSRSRTLGHSVLKWDIYVDNIDLITRNAIERLPPKAIHFEAPF